MKHMTDTKLMVMVILTFTITWLIMGTLVFLLSDLSFKTSLTEPGVGFFMVVFGWIPSVIVYNDLTREDLMERIKNG